MDERSKQILDHFVTRFVVKNYNYTYLKAMLGKAKGFQNKDSVLVTGSSYALSGIKESAWKHVVSCSCSSQDLYYDFRCAYNVISAVPPNTFSRCFIVKGYYAAYEDLSSAKQERERMIARVYYPLLQDAHNWETPYAADLFEGVFSEATGSVSDDLKQLVEHSAVDRMLAYGNFYNELRQRGGTIFNLSEKEWQELAEEEVEELSKYRADCHNQLFMHKGSMEENKKIFKDYIHFLHLNHILPVFVIAPFMPSYSKYILSEMKDSIMELFEAASGEVHFVDFNQSDCFNKYDFVDTDHLSETGAQKMSRILVDMFGK